MEVIKQEITNVLIYKDQHYWITVIGYKENFDGTEIIPDDTHYYIASGLEHNGFEYKEDAYAYIMKLRGENATNI